MATVPGRLDALGTEIQGRLWEFLLLVPLFLVAVVIVVAFGFVARFITRGERVLGFRIRSPFLRELARQTVRTAIVVVGVLVGLELLDATALVSAVLGTAGVFGLAIGFAFRDLVENYIASVLLSLRRPFAPNDHVLIEGVEGRVLGLTSRATIILTPEGNHVRIPNATVFKSILVNYTRKPERRFTFTVGVGNDEDLAEVVTLAVEVLQGMDEVLAEPRPFALVHELGDSTVSVRIAGWVDQRTADLGRTRSEAIRRIKEAFDGAGISMPEPMQRVMLEPSPSVPAAELPATSSEASHRPRKAEAADRPRSADAAAALDTSRDRALDEEVAEERRALADDLLDPEAPVE